MILATATSPSLGHAVSQQRKKSKTLAQPSWEEQPHFEYQTCWEDGRKQWVFLLWDIHSSVLTRGRAGDRAGGVRERPWVWKTSSQEWPCGDGPVRLRPSVYTLPRNPCTCSVLFLSLLVFLFWMSSSIPASRVCGSRDYSDRQPHGWPGSELT